jgi:hypothetical protein
MRDAIREKLLEDIDSLKGVWQPNMADKNTELPYAVVKIGTEIESNIRHAFNRSIDIWIYTEREDYNKLDALVIECIKSLNDVELITEDDIVFGLEYTGSSPDGFYDPELQALTKTVTFTQGMIIK